MGGVCRVWGIRFLLLTTFINPFLPLTATYIQTFTRKPIETYIHEINPEDDLFLILASDGVWDVLSNDEAGACVMQAALTKPWEEVAKELVLHAKVMVCAHALLMLRVVKVRTNMRDKRLHRHNLTVFLIFFSLLYIRICTPCAILIIHKMASSPSLALPPSPLPSLPWKGSLDNITAQVVDLSRCFCPLPQSLSRGGSPRGAVRVETASSR